MTPTLFSATLALASTGLMVYSILLAVRIFKQLPSGDFLKWWRLLLVLIIGFAICYFVFALAISMRGEPDSLMQLVVAVFFFGAVFVLLTLQLFMHTFTSVEKTGWLSRNGILDEQSGIYNLRYFEMRLNEEFERARRYNSPLTLFLIEIDNFKKTSNSYGRIMGGKVFGAICKLLKEGSRSSDIMARYGGDQVIILLPNTALFSARKAAEKYRAIIEDKVLDVDDEERAIASVRLNYTVSIGVSALQNDVKHASELIRRADIALYKAKDRGRNRVAIYGE
jgi:diguanylate cyclase (GGDEF)-like protein